MTRKHGARSRIHPSDNWREYQAWLSMRRRCLLTTYYKYPDYGGRGIAICDRWLNSFVAFVADMGPRPAGMSLDRIDNNGNYEPVNCRWATPREQSNNRRSTRVIEFNGERKSISEWARVFGLNKTTLKDRLNRGWAVADALRPVERVVRYVESA